LRQWARADGDYLGRFFNSWLTTWPGIPRRVRVWHLGDLVAHGYGCHRPVCEALFENVLSYDCDARLRVSHSFASTG
jgi:hypothetical protein